MLKILINGANGKMGAVTVDAINQQPDMTLVGTCTRQDHLAEKIQSLTPDVVIDFTAPDCVYQNTQTIIENDAHPVIGTTGLTTKQIEALQALCEQKSLGGIIAPNFSIGAILMMRFSKIAAKYFEHAEIIELHHEKKLDAPSGTAIKTAELMREEKTFTQDPHGLPIHSVRLPGLFAHQAVIFGELGETFRLQHDAIDRQAMMPGVVLACQKVVALKQLVYGLDTLID